jgi:hypothetical protein
MEITDVLAGCDDQATDQTGRAYQEMRPGGRAAQQDDDARDEERGRNNVGQAAAEKLLWRWICQGNAGAGAEASLRSLELDEDGRVAGCVIDRRVEKIHALIKLSAIKRQYYVVRLQLPCADRVDDPIHTVEGGLGIRQDRAGQPKIHQGEVCQGACQDERAGQETKAAGP